MLRQRVRPAGITLVRLLAVTSVALALPASCGATWVTDVSTGLSVSHDYHERLYRDAANKETSADGQGTSTTASQDNERHSRAVLAPFVQLLSQSAKSTALLHLNPRVSHDLLDDTTDLYGAVNLQAQHNVTSRLLMSAGNHFLRSDSEEVDDERNNQQSDAASPADDTTTPADEPQLSDTVGRQRYWRNTTSLGARFQYSLHGSITFDSSFSMLRNDDDEDNGYQEYDRSVLQLGNDHRYNQAWLSRVTFSFVRGDYRPGAAEEPAKPGDVISSDDVREYHLLAEADNTSFIHNMVRMHYDYTATEYDDGPVDDGFMHQAQLSWRHEYSANLYTVAGLGPSYVKTEQQDGRWGGNGRAEIGYDGKRASCSLSIIKTYETDNFSGTGKQGFIDAWDVRVSGRYRLSERFDVSGRFGYRTEDRDVSIAPTVDADSSGDAAEQDTIFETTTTREYRAGAGVGYRLTDRFRAAVDYRYLRQQSDEADEDYDDHQLVVSLTWSDDLFRW